MDRLSELHDSLIHHIFSFLPTEDVVRTMVLSKRWVDLWTTVPYFSFVAKSVRLDLDNYNKFRDFVYQTMKHWKGTKIHKFSVYLMYCNHSFHRDIAVWFRIAEQHKVEKLHLAHRSDHPDRNHYIGCCLPRCVLFSAPYTGVGIGMPVSVCIGTIRWDQLKSLTIDSLDVDQSVIDNVLFGSPVLETLELCCPRNVSIHSASLKKLCLCYDEKNYYPDSKYPDSALHIWTPNLQVLRIEGIVRTQFSSLFVPSLIEAILTFEHITTYLSQPQPQVDDMLKVIFQSIGHVDKLVVGHWIIKVLQVMEKTALPLPLLNLKLLTIDSFVGSRSLAGIVNLLKISPNISMLTIRNDIGDDNEKQLEDKWSCRKRSRIPEDELPDTFLMNLRILELDVKLYAYKPVFSIAKFVLKNANALKRIVIRRKDSLVREMQQLLRMSGYPTNAELVFTLRASPT